MTLSISSTSVIFSRVSHLDCIHLSICEPLIWHFVVALAACIWRSGCSLLRFGSCRAYLSHLDHVRLLAIRTSHNTVRFCLYYTCRIMPLQVRIQNRQRRYV